MNEHRSLGGPKIDTVTVAGVNGAVGPAVVKALHDAGFKVQAFSRGSTTLNEDLCVQVVKVDYGNTIDLKSHLKGQDAVISVLGDTAGAVAAQENLIATSVDAGVKRFVPSEFGPDTKNNTVQAMPFFHDKVRHQKLLKTAAVENPGFTYSIIITGPFLDWGLGVVPFIIDVGARSAEVFDGGDTPFSTTRVSTLGKAVASTLDKPETTANRTLYIHDGITTQNQLIEREERLVQAAPFSKTSVDCKSLEEQAWKDFHASADPLSWIFPFINLSIWSKEARCAFWQNDNELLGIRQLRGPELEATLTQEIVKAKEALVPDDKFDTLPFCKAPRNSAIEQGKQKLLGFKSGGSD